LRQQLTNAFPNTFSSASNDDFFVLKVEVH
jgi:hypothetical protein